jgi:hypothetical protein
MGRLTDAARDQLSRNQAKAEVPEWFGKMALVVAALLGVAMGFQILTNRGSTGSVAPPTTTIAPGGPSTSTPTGSTGTTTVAPTPSGGVVADDGATITLLSDSGGTTSVPAGAASLATKVALATVTGNWAGVAVPTGFVPPAVTAPSPAATVVDTQVISAATTGNDIAFRVRIDPTGTGTGSPVTKTVIIARVPTGFAWAP